MTESETLKTNSRILNETFRDRFRSFEPGKGPCCQEKSLSHEKALMP